MGGMSQMVGNIRLTGGGDCVLGVGSGSGGSAGNVGGQVSGLALGVAIATDCVAPLALGGRWRLSLALFHFHFCDFARSCILCVQHGLD